MGSKKFKQLAIKLFEFLFELNYHLEFGFTSNRLRIHSKNRSVFSWLLRVDCVSFTCCLLWVAMPHRWQVPVGWRSSSLSPSNQAQFCRQPATAGAKMSYMKFGNGLDRWEIYGYIRTLIWMVVANIFYVHPYLGKIPISTNIFPRGWNQQLVINLIQFF